MGSTNGQQYALRTFPYNLSLKMNDLPRGADEDQITEFLLWKLQNKLVFLQENWHEEMNGFYDTRDPREVKQVIRQILRPHRAKLQQGKITNALVNSIVALLEQELYVPDRHLIALHRERSKYINLQNGLFNLETFSLEEPRPELFITYQVNFAFDPHADCSTFKQYLATSLVDEQGKTDEEMVMFCEEIIGYSLTSRTDQKLGPWLIGERDSGKSTLIATMKLLLGPLFCAIDANQLGKNRFMTALLIDKRVVACGELEQHLLLPEALIKALLGGVDEIFADVKHRPGTTFVNEAKPWFAMNTAPRIRDKSGAMLRRLRPLLFPRTVPPDQQIPNLLMLLEQERAGIFNLALSGYQRLLTQGSFTYPKRSQTWLEAYKFTNDVFAQYAAERLVFDAGSFIHGEPLYEDCKKWCMRTGNQVPSPNNAALEWPRLGLEKRTVNGRSRWYGARLRENES